MRICFLIITLWGVLCSHPDEVVPVAEHYKLSITQLFALADSNNRSIQAQAAAVAVSQEAVKVAKNAALPTVDAMVSFSYNGDGTITDRNFSHPFTAEIPSFGTNFSLEVTQIIYAGGAIRNGVAISELQAQLAALYAEGNRQDVRFMLVGYYLDLCKMQNQMQVLDRHIEQTEQMLAHMQAKYDQGAALLNDITRYELQREELRFQRIQMDHSIQIVSRQLARALGLPADTVFDTDAQEVANLPGNSFQTTMTQNNAYWQTKTTQEAVALKTASTYIDINRRAEKVARAGRLPQIALTAADYLNGPITIDIPAINKNFNYWFVGVGVKYPIGNLFKTHKEIKTRELAVQQAMKQRDVLEEQLQTAVDAAFIRYTESFDLLATKQKSEKLAQQNYEVVSYRYENDLALLTDLLDASAQKLDAELQSVNSQINIVFNYYKLKHISGTL